MEISLKDWRLSRETNGKEVTVFFKDVSVGRLSNDGSDLETLVNRVLADPPCKSYPYLFKNNLLDFSRHKCDKGIWKLIDSGLITPKQGWEILPTQNFKRTALRRGVWGDICETYKPQIHKKPTPSISRISYNDVDYVYKKGNWYKVWYDPYDNLKESLILLKGQQRFRSIWDARVRYARRQCSLVEVAEYRLSAVLECIGDLMTYRIKENWYRVYEEVMSFLNERLLTGSKPIIKGFSRDADGNFQPIFFKTYNEEDSIWKLFTSLLARVCQFDMSGYEARLHLTNGYFYEVERERLRFQKQKEKVFSGNASPGTLLYVPWFLNRQAKIDSMSLEEVRDYLQKKNSERFSLGPFDEDKFRCLFFKHRSFQYGLWVDSGKIFTLSQDDGYCIPYNWDTLDIEDRIQHYRQVYGEAPGKSDYQESSAGWFTGKVRYVNLQTYDSMSQEEYWKEIDDSWCQKSRLARKDVYTYMKTQGMSYRKALFIAEHHRLHVKDAYLESVKRFICGNVNRSASLITIKWSGPRNWCDLEERKVSVACYDW